MAPYRGCPAAQSATSVEHKRIAAKGDCCISTSGEWTILLVHSSLGERTLSCRMPRQVPVVALPAVSKWHEGLMPQSPTGFSLAIEYFREEDGRWLADIAAVPGVTVYGRTRKQATAAVQALAL